MYQFNSTNRKEAELELIEKLSDWLDRKYVLPGTKFRFGLDPIIGLIPFLGHGVTFVISGALVLLMLRHGASGKVAIKMVLNVLLDTIVGAVPVAGNVFDFLYKANTKNVRLLKEHYKEGKHHGSGWGIVAIILIAFLVLLIGIVALFAWGIREIAALF